MSDPLSAAGTARVTVVIVNFNGGANVVRCLESLAAQTVPPERIVLVDNASSDGSLIACRELVAAGGPLAGRTTIDALPDNVGFAAGTNRGLAAADTEFVALLNPDAFPEPGWLGALLAAARQHPDAAAFGSRQMLAGTPDRLDGVGDVYHISGLSWRAGHGCRMTAADAQDGEIFSACAAAALYRRAAFDEVGGFDEDFFCYFEDVDLGFRLRLAGYGARYVSNAVVSHVGGGSQGGDRNDFAGFHGHRNLVWCFVKNMPPPLLWACLPAHLLQSIVILAVSVTRGEFRGIVKAKWHALIGLPKCWRKRQFVQAKNRVSATAVWRSLDKSLCRRRCLACQTGSHRSRS